jgi:uncharacterized protein YdaU (DUF1376 family)
LSKEKSPAFQHYPKDILSDLNYQVMSWAERGMYRHLMDICWLEKSIPSDEFLLARILNLSEDEFKGSWQIVGKCFKVSSSLDQLIHPRLELERQKQAEWREKCAKGGKHSAHKRKTNKEHKAQQGSCDLLASKRQVNVNSSSPSSSSYLNNNKKTTVPSEQTLFKQSIESEYLKIRGCKLISDNTDWISLSNLIKSCNGNITQEQLKEAWTLFLQSTDPFHQKQGHPLRWWCSNVNAFLGKRPLINSKPKQIDILDLMLEEPDDEQPGSCKIR